MLMYSDPDSGLGRFTDLALHKPSRIGSAVRYPFKIRIDIESKDA